MTLLRTICACVQEFVDTVADRMFEAGFCANQASVKYLTEWMMILILVHYPHHMDNFWTCFSKVRLHSYLTCNNLIVDWIITLFELIFIYRIMKKQRQAVALSSQSSCISMSSSLNFRTR